MLYCSKKLVFKYHQFACFLGHQTISQVRLPKKKEILNKMLPCTLESILHTEFRIQCSYFAQNSTWFVKQFECNCSALQVIPFNKFSIFCLILCDVTVTHYLFILY